MPATERKSAESPKYDIELLSKKHDKDNFYCEEESLTSFLLSFARQQSRKDLSKTYVLTFSGDRRVLGFYTITTSSLKLDVLPERKGYPPKYDVAAIKLARLARDISMKRSDVGEKLLLDCFDRSVEIADKVGAAVLELDAIKPEVRDKFYAKFGFKQLLDSELHLYLPMSTIRKLVANR